MSKYVSDLGRFSDDWKFSARKEVISLLNNGEILHTDIPKILTLINQSDSPSALTSDLSKLGLGNTVDEHFSHFEDKYGFSISDDNKAGNKIIRDPDIDPSKPIDRIDPDPDSPVVDRPLDPESPDRDRDEIYRDDSDGDGIINGNDDDFVSDSGGIFGSDGIFGSNFVSAFTKLFQSIISKYTDATVTGGEEIRNQWDLDKMNLANEFSAQQAEISRDWQEQMYEQYNSLSGKILQAEQAGVNPMFAVTGNAVSPMSVSGGSPSGAVASGSGQKSGSDLLSSIASLIGLKSQIKKTEAETEAIETETDISLQKLSYEINNMQSSTDLNLQKVVESATSIEKMKADIGLTTKQAEVATEQMNYLIAQANYINAIREPEMRAKRAQALISEWQEKNKELFKGLDIGMDAVNTLVSLGVGIFNAKTGRMFTNSPVVVPKDASVYFPFDIVH